MCPETETTPESKPESVIEAKPKEAINPMAGNTSNKAPKVDKDDLIEQLTKTVESLDEKLNKLLEGKETPKTEAAPKKPGLFDGWL
jgi:hypothetical protein